LFSNHFRGGQLAAIQHTDRPTNHRDVLLATEVRMRLTNAPAAAEIADVDPTPR
jgi:uncharacterized protein (TIGR02118 family)